MRFFSEVYAWALAHGPAVAAFLVVVLPSVITGLSSYPRAGDGVIGLFKVLLSVASWVTHHDSPGTFKAPLSLPKRPDSHGFVRIGVLAALAGFAALLLAGPAFAQEPPVPQRLVGGCNAKGTICAGPSVAISPAAWDLTHHTVVASLSPGLGYGVTFWPDRWYSCGLDYFLTMQSGPVSGISQALMAKAANGYLRVGIARQLFDGRKTWLVPVGIGVDF